MKASFWKGLILGVALSVFGLVGLTAAGAILNDNFLQSKVASASSPKDFDGAAKMVIDVATNYGNSTLGSQEDHLQTANEAQAELLYIQVKQNNMILNKLDQLLKK